MKILIVDDEIDSVELISYAIKPAGFDVVAQTNPLMALNLYKSDSFDVVITDVAMYEMSGIELLIEVRKYNPAARVIIISGNVDIKTPITALNNKAFGYFVKPVNFEELIDMLYVIEKELQNEHVKLDDIKNIYFENIKLKRLYYDLLKIITKDNEKNPLTRI